MVALEATSDYWRAVYYPLQDAGLNLMLVNPAHLRGIKGRKTDPSDAAFLARAAASGMVMASLCPSARCANCVSSPGDAPRSALTADAKCSGWKRNSRTADSN